MTTLMERADTRDVSVWGMNVRYVQAGEGPAVVLLHGLGASLLTWYCNIDALAEAGFRAIAIDLPGYGDSDKPDHLSYDPPSAVEFLFDFSEKLGIHRFSVVGSSGGALVGGLLALTYPEKVDKLVMSGPAGLGRSISWFLRLVSIPGVGELFYRLWVQDNPGAVKQIFHRPPDFLDQLLPEMSRVRQLPGARTAMLRSVRSSINCWGLHRQHNLLERLRDLPSPLMTVWGEEDVIIPVSQAERVREVLSDSLVYRVPECGHWPHMEQSELFNGLLASFLKGTLSKETLDEEEIRRGR